MQFLDTLEDTLGQMAGNNMILAGDFNCILDHDLDKNSDSIPSTASINFRDRFKNFIEEWSLQDIWRIRHPRKKIFTFRLTNYASRLDLFVISSHLTEGISHLKSQVSAHSDHVILSLLVNSTRSSWGPGLWKFDSSLLSREDFIKGMTDFLTTWSSPSRIAKPLFYLGLA